MGHYRYQENAYIGIDTDTDLIIGESLIYDLIIDDYSVCHVLPLSVHNLCVHMNVIVRTALYHNNNHTCMHR